MTLFKYPQGPKHRLNVSSLYDKKALIEGIPMQHGLPTLSIPRLVPLPGHTVHLHIYEPRYRQLVAAVDSTESREVLIAQGIPTKRPQECSAPIRTAASFLTMNQPLYDPAAVGGRGQLTIEARHPDGRYHISIAVRRRVRLLSPIALVPFPAYSWMHLPDQPAETPESHRAESHLVLELLSAAQLLFSQAKRTETALETLGQRTQPNLAELSFLLLKYFSLKCSDAQAHLEDCSAISRGQRLLGWLCELMSLQARQDPEQTRIHPNDWADVSVLSLRRAQKHTGLISEPGSR